MHLTQRLIALALACALAIQPVGADELPELGDVASNDFSLSTEKKIGQQIMHDIRWREPSYLDDADIETYLSQLGNRLAAVSNDPGFGFTFFAINDPTAIGAELAIKQAKRQGVFLTAVDGAPDVVVALKDAASLVEGSAAQNPYQMASEGVKIGYDIMNGKKPKDSVMLLPVPLITKANVKDYTGWVK